MHGTRGKAGEVRDMAEYTPGRGAPTGGGSREARLSAVLARWPVLAEP